MKITIPYLLKCLKNVVIVLQKYMACNIQFLYSQKWSKGRDKHCAEFLTLLSLKSCRQILISFLDPSGFEKVSFLFLHFFITLERKGKTENTDTVFKLHYIGTYPASSWFLLRQGETNCWQGNRSVLPKVQLKWLKIGCMQTLNMHPISWKYSFEKKSKTILTIQTFFWLNEIKTTRHENNYLQFTNKRLDLLHNNSAQMLTRQDVKYCSVWVNLMVHFSSTRHRG